MTWIFLAAGLVLLLGGAELLVRGASRLAAGFGIHPLVIGLTVVAFGTSAPELAVSLGAALSGTADLAFGNVVGSNNFNLLFILGLSALVAPLAVTERLVRQEVPLMVAASALTAGLAWNGVLGRGEGAFLVTLGLASVAVQLRGQRGAARTPRPKPSLGSFLQILAGLACLLLGSRWLVTGALDVARDLGVSELVIGVTIVAAGTSLPEVATSVLASLRGERDIAIGNVVGSNVFNLLWVLGLSSAISPRGIAVAPQAWHLDLPLMIASALLCWPLAMTGRTISRREGSLLLGAYLAYVGFLIYSR